MARTIDARRHACPARRSWVASANGHADFPIQNLPFGVFSPPRRRAARRRRDWRHDPRPAGGCSTPACCWRCGRAGGASRVGPTLNPFLALGARAALARCGRRLSQLLSHEQRRARAIANRCFIWRRLAGCTCRRAIGDYTDFYAGIHHATNVGKLFRPDNPLLPNYKYVPIGYHGRASSLVRSACRCRRPRGPAQAGRSSRRRPSGRARSLDYELELGVWIGPGNALGDARFRSARPQSTSPASACSTTGRRATSRAGSTSRSARSWPRISPRRSRPGRDAGSARAVPHRAAGAAGRRSGAAALPAGRGRPAGGALDLELEVLLQHRTRCASAGIAPHRLALSERTASVLDRRAAGRAPRQRRLQPAARRPVRQRARSRRRSVDGYGSLLEITRGGKDAIALPSGEERRFLEDGDEVFLRAHAMREGFAPIGFGECRAVILAAP